MQRLTACHSLSQPVTGFEHELRPNAPRLRSRKWIAQLMIPAKGGTSACKHLGLYEDEADAARAFDRCGALFLEPSCALGSQRQQGSGALRISGPRQGGRAIPWPESGATQLPGA